MLSVGGAAVAAEVAAEPVYGKMVSGLSNEELSQLSGQENLTQQQAKIVEDEIFKRLEADGYDEATLAMLNGTDAVVDSYVSVTSYYYNASRSMITINYKETYNKGETPIYNSSSIYNLHSF